MRFAIDRAGLVGADGPTHAGAFDVAYLSCLPGMVVMAAADEVGADAYGGDRRRASTIGPRRSAIRAGRGLASLCPSAARRLRSARAACCARARRWRCCHFGARLPECLVAADQLAGFGLPATVADARFAKPLDMDLLRQLAANHEVLITVEEGSSGGFGAMVLQALAREGLLDRGLKVRTLICPTASSSRTSRKPCMRKPASMRAASSPRCLQRSARSATRQGPASPERASNRSLQSWLNFSTASARPRSGSVSAGRGRS